MTEDSDKIFSEIKNLPFVNDTVEKYRKEGFEFSPETIKIETLDEFGQCTVWLGFEDQFVIRDAMGNWREASASECVSFNKGELPGSMKLIN